MSIPSAAARRGASPRRSSHTSALSPSPRRGRSSSGTSSAGIARRVVDGRSFWGCTGGPAMSTATRLDRLSLDFRGDIEGFAD